MIVYLANKTQFRADILSNRIEEIVHESVKRELGKSVGAAELTSWKNSLRHMDTVLEDSGIPDDAGVAIEFNIPQTGKRVDFIITGTRADLHGKGAQASCLFLEDEQATDAKATGRMPMLLSNLFVGSGAFTATPSNTFQGLIVDEAHRLNEKSGLFSNLGENQIKELIDASTFTVFFLDEDQRIHWKDIGNKTQICDWAESLGAMVTEMDLESQFRCNGSDGYLAWIDRVLQVRETANTTLEGANYQFKVCETATELKELIYRQNRLNNRARMVAGYCWDWVSRKTKSNPVPRNYDIKLDGGDFKAKWNLSEDGSLWIVKPDSVHEVGCIHTCQGLELDYVGVIIGPDLVVRDGVVVTDGAKRSGGDSSIKGYKGLLKNDSATAREKADLIIKNTYRTLMTRGTKGCYVYATDPETNLYLQTQGAGALLPEFEEPEIPKTPPAYPFLILSPEEAASCPNAVPVFNIKIAAGDFSKEQWLLDCQYAELPDHFTAKPGFFLAQVVGDSMNRRIPNGSWCLFREPSEGSRNGKVVIVQSRDIQDPDTGGQYTVKIYRSEKTETGDSWSHRSIHLEPDSMDINFKPLTLAPDTVNELSVVGEFVGIIG
jgi:hypothetical protein